LPTAEPLKTKTAKRKRGDKGPSAFDNPVVSLSTGVVVALVFILLTSVFIVYPTIRSILDLRNTIETETQLLADLEERGRRLARAQLDKTSFQAQFERLAYAIPNESNYIQNFKIIERTAADVTASGEQFVLMRASLGEIPVEAVGTRTARGYERTEMAFSLTVRADFRGIQAFLMDLKKNLRNFRIDQVNFAAPENQSQDYLDISIRLTTIYYAA
jgi:hypothetical protein